MPVRSRVAAASWSAARGAAAIRQSGPSPAGSSTTAQSRLPRPASRFRFVSVFAGGVTNTGAVTAGSTAIVVSRNATASGAIFAGSIVNSGAISGGRGLTVAMVADSGGTFLGSIVNNATISAPGTGIGVDDVGAALFSGDITNSGAISGSFGLDISRVADSSGTFNGSIVNTATISAQQDGIKIVHVGAALFSGASPTVARSLRSARAASKSRMWLRAMARSAAASSIGPRISPPTPPLTLRASAPRCFRQHHQQRRDQCGRSWHRDRERRRQQQRHVQRQHRQCSHDFRRSNRHRDWQRRRGAVFRQHHQ